MQTMRTTQSAFAALGARVRQLRGRRSVEACAQAAGIEPERWKQIEAGMANPTLIVLVAVARVVGAELFIGGTDAVAIG